MHTCIHKEKKSMFKFYFLEGDAVKKSFFKKYTNKLTKLKASSKKLYYSKKLKNNQNDPQKTWDVIRSAFPVSYKRSTDTPQSLKINECHKNDAQKIADHFNKLFCSIGSNLANAVVNSDPKSFENTSVNVLLLQFILILSILPKFTTLSTR